MASSSRRVYGWYAPANSSSLGPISTRRPGVHHGDAVGQVGDHGEVVRDVQRRDAVRAGEVADRLEHVRLRGHVQRRGGLVQHDDARPVGHGHGDDHALLLAAGELVRVAAQEGPVAGQQHLGHHLLEARLALRLGVAEVVRLEDLHELVADAQRRVQRRRGVLRHVRDQAAPDAAQVAARGRQHVGAGDVDDALGDLGAAALVGEQRGRGRGLARGRLADEAEHLALVDGERDVVVDVDPGGVEDDAQVAHGEDDVAERCPFGAPLDRLTAAAVHAWTPCCGRCPSWRAPGRRP